MSQAVSNWLVKWVISPIYKCGIFGIIAPTDPILTFDFQHSLRHPTKGRSTGGTPHKNQPPAVAFRGSKIPKGLSPQFCQAKGDFQTKTKTVKRPQNGSMQGTKDTTVIYENLLPCCIQKLPKFIKFDADVLLKSLINSQFQVSLIFILMNLWFITTVIRCGATHPQQSNSINSCSRLVPVNRRKQYENV